MLISLSWLRELVAVKADDAEVAHRLTARGLTVDALSVVGGDTVLDIDVPANRPDALGHLGVAREVAAAFGAPLTPRPGTKATPGGSGDAPVSVTVEASSLCGRYTARIVRGVRVGPSPAWVVARLSACGQRSVNNVVDASNLVMLELGQPVHFFDLARVAGPQICVREARANEPLTTLDGVARTLSPGMIVIADAEGAVALGGVMGGARTEITAATRDVLIEAAWFAPRAVRDTARTLSLSTDASQRFERGCDPEAPPAAQELAASLLAELAGGTAATTITDVRSLPTTTPTLLVRTARASRLLGYALTPTEAESALLAIGLSPRPHGEAIEVTLPSWRVDLKREADLIEEIGRHLGYDRIPATPPPGAPRQASASRRNELEERVRDRLAALGFHEAVTYAMIGRGDDDAFVTAGTPAPLALINPIAETLAVLRRSLLPGLLRAADQNLRRGAASVRLFEVGGVFHARESGELPDEPSRAGFAWSGSAEPPHWAAPTRQVDAWDAAGIVEDVLAEVLGPDVLTRERSGIPALDPGRSIAWRDGAGRTVAWCGPVHPNEAARLDLPAPVWLAEVDLATAGRSEARAPAYRPIPRIPGTWRDLSLVLSAGVASRDILAALAAVHSPAPVSLTWIDRYSGAPLSQGDVAMTLRVILQPLERTLNDAEAEAYRAELVQALDSVPGVRLRQMDR